MKIIEQTIFKVELSHPNKWSTVFLVEADTFEEALATAKEVIIGHYEDWSIKTIKAIKAHTPLFKSLTKTTTVEI